MLCAVFARAAAPAPAAAQAHSPLPDLPGLVRDGMRADTIPGAVVIVVDSGRVIFSRGFGVADLATGRRVQPDSTLFRLGSVTKTLTALGILRAVERGAVALETPVADIVPLPALRAHADPPVRIGDLLGHTGGFDQTGLGRHATSASERPSLRAFLERYLVPIRPPGAVATYDTYGMSLAGYVLEVVDGVPYAEAMQAEVFEPLGMSQTFIEAPPAVRERLAVGYGLEDGEPVAQPYESYVTLPASSADATASDVARLMIALLGDGSAGGRRLFQPATVLALRTGAFTSGPVPFWDGWWVGHALGHPVLYHGGVMRGYSSQLVLLPDRGAGLFVAYNRDPETGSPPRLRSRLTDAFLQAFLTQGATAAPAESASIATGDMAGWWVGTLGCFTCQEGEGWPLRVERIESRGPGALEFRGARWVAVDSSTFQREGSGATLRFGRDDAGHIRFANAGQDGFERLDAALVDRVSAWMGPEREPEALRTQLARATAFDDRGRAMAVLAARPPALRPAGTFLLHPVGSEDGEPIRVELRDTDGRLEGWVQPRPDRPRRTIGRVIVGGNEIWLVVDVPGGELDVRLVVDGSAVSGTVREGLEEIPVRGQYVASRP